MNRKRYDTFIVGHISLDEIAIRGETTRRLGGAVYFSCHAAVAGGFRTGILTKTAPADLSLLSMFDVLAREDIYHLPSRETTSIRNLYLSDDMERRDCFALRRADAFTEKDIPDIDSELYHLAGLIAGDYDNDLIPFLSRKGRVAADMQGFLRTVTDGGLMVFRDWPDKKKYLPSIDFLKTDAAEAEVMTGCSDRREAARMLRGWGAKEVMVTHNSEVIVYDGSEFFAWPLKPRNLSGRTGRGDTCFSAYITERLKKPPREALLYAAAMVSLKMETPGPFRGSRNDVEHYIKSFYP